MRWWAALAVVASACGAEPARVVADDDHGDAAGNTSGAPPLVSGDSSSSSDGRPPAEGSRGGDEGSWPDSGDGESGDGSGGHAWDRPFVDVTLEAGLAIDHGPASIAPHCLIDDVRQPSLGDHCLAERALGSASVGDYDGDGWPDLHLGSLLGPGHVMRNRGDGTFEDVTLALGITGPAASGASAWLDIENDGDLDLAIVGFADLRDHLFVADGSGGFVEDGLARGFAGIDGVVHVGTSIAIGDYDRDGLVDVFVGEWRFDDVLGTDVVHARLLHNIGGAFEDVTAAMGVDLRARVPLEEATPGVFVYGPAFVDLDGDGWPELSLTSDFMTSLLFWNEGGTAFVEGTVAAGLGDERHGMGAAFGDIDGDGDIDHFASAILNVSHPEWGNRLYLNDGDRTFTDATDLWAVRDGGWGWGAAMFDHDGDRDLEIVMAAGWPSSDFTNNPMRFFESPADAEPCLERATELGLDLHGWGRGLVTFDYDRDGDLDVLVGAFSEPPVLYRNDVAQGRFLAVQAVGSASNRQGLGVRVRVQPEPDAAWLVREIGVGAHLMGHEEAVAHFGLGSIDEVHRVEITWPATGAVQVLGPVAPDQRLVVAED